MLLDQVQSNIVRLHSRLSLFCGAIVDLQSDSEKHALCKPVPGAARIRKVVSEHPKRQKVVSEIMMIPASA